MTDHEGTFTSLVMKGRLLPLVTKGRILPPTRDGYFPSTREEYCPHNYNHWNYNTMNYNRTSMGELESIYLDLLARRYMTRQPTSIHPGQDT